MKASMENFRRLMEKLGTGQIVELMRSTWDAEEGPLLREAGFEVIDGRVDEDASDRIYARLYAACAA